MKVIVVIVVVVVSQPDRCTPRSVRSYARKVMGWAMAMRADRLVLCEIEKKCGNEETAGIKEKR